MIRLAAAMVVTVAVAACTTTPSPPIVTARSVSLAMEATGLGPCSKQWYISCNYGIRVEGPGGYDHRGNFAWDQGLPSSGPEPAHGPAGPVASTGVWGDVPATLGPGLWTISFRLWYGSDAIQYEPVPGGTPRYAEEDPFRAACSAQLDTASVTSVTLHVAFQGSSCTIETELDGGTSVSAPALFQKLREALASKGFVVKDWEGL